MTPSSQVEDKARLKEQDGAVLLTFKDGAIMARWRAET
jgi:hypothetical protein